MHVLSEVHPISASVIRVYVPKVLASLQSPSTLDEKSSEIFTCQKNFITLICRQNNLHKHIPLKIYFGHLPLRSHVLVCGLI